MMGVGHRNTQLQCETCIVRIRIVCNFVIRTLPWTARSLHYRSSLQEFPGRWYWLDFRRLSRKWQNQFWTQIWSQKKRAWCYRQRSDKIRFSFKPRKFQWRVFPWIWFRWGTVDGVRVYIFRFNKLLVRQNRQGGKISWRDGWGCLFWEFHFGGLCLGWRMNAGWWFGGLTYAFWYVLIKINN